MKHRYSTAPLVALLLAACSNAPVAPSSSGHIDAETQAATAPAANIPQPVQNSVTPPKPKATAKVETYSVVVNNVLVHDLLFALARDAKVNVDVHPGITGTVTLNAIDQTLPQLLTRISKQVDMRWEMDGANLVVMPDSPFLRTYKVDYVNMSRDTTGNVAINTQIASVSPNAAGSGTGAAAGGTSGNISSTKVDNVAKHRFWDSLEENLKDILRETDKEIIVKRRVADSQEQQAQANAATAPGGGTSAAAGQASAPPQSRPPVQATLGQASKEYETLQAAAIMVNRETGIVLVRATSRQHEKIQEFLDLVQTSAKRQVLIEATIVEVGLSQNYQQGIDWQYFNQASTSGAIGQGSTTRSFRVNPTSGVFEATTNVSSLPSAVGNTIFSAAFKRGDFLTAIKLLETFGTLKVISSPKLSVLNNQTAMLKVVNNIVYFQVKADTTQNQTGSLSNFTTTPQSVSVGLVMSVTPQISESNQVLLNVRPTISRIIGSKRDPHPSLPADIPNLVPEIQTREMESLMSISDGDIAVLGGLMQDQVNDTDDTVPGISRLPWIGSLFAHKNDTTSKTELVIFLRPTVIKDPSIQGDYAPFRHNLPKQNFLNRSSRTGENTVGGRQ
jgi:MSHA type pilus biogenesis protein MshL